MTKIRLFPTQQIPENLISNLDRREAALWIRSQPATPAALEALADFSALPWRMVFSELADPSLIKALEKRTDTDPLIRKRGFIQIIDEDPSRIQLPECCLPIYLLNGRDITKQDNFHGRLRRMTMLEELRRSGVRYLVIVSFGDDPIPPDVNELWVSGFRSLLIILADTTNIENFVETSSIENDGYLLRLTVNQIIEEILKRYASTYPEERIVIRARDRAGNFRKLDITDLDEPDRPILDKYAIIEEHHLSTLTPSELSEEEFVSFFQNPESSWRPYGAGLPWEKDDQVKRRFGELLNKLDTIGPTENCVAYVLAEPGAGGTTLARMLAWEYAREGYPVLIAKQLPFVADALQIANFLNHVRHAFEKQSDGPMLSTDIPTAFRNTDPDSSSDLQRYEVPWIVVFDRIHWDNRDTELRRFRNDLEKQGRPICVLVVTGPIRAISYFDTSVFKQVAELNHVVDIDGARRLGKHLNRFLQIYGKARQQWQWDRFYEQHTVRYLDGTSAFWVALSFWIQGQYDLSQTIQEWVFRSFREKAEEGPIQAAILEIAAMSSERLPLPEGLLPISDTQWPVSHLLEDHRSSLAALGLVKISAAGKRYWALVHDILGRYLINALFYDFTMRTKLGIIDAKDPEHLRFLLLRKISQKRELAERDYKDIGEEFATTIFKIDPDHGHANFAPFWKEVLSALDCMARPLRDTSRVFRHHTAISRRRIAKLDEAFYGVTLDDKVTLLSRAIDDIRYALSSIEYTPGSEPDVNLYNSLAHACHDLADLEEKRGAIDVHVIKLRNDAKDAARRAYEESPTNSFVIETYVRDLLASARAEPESAIRYAIHTLGVLFSAIASNEESYRRAQLGSLADRALEILFQNSQKSEEMVKVGDAIDVLRNAWILLAQDVDTKSGTALSELPAENCIRALNALSDPLGKRNAQVIRLSYELTCIVYPNDFKRQIEYLEQLQSSDYLTTPQMRLEYAILLYQNNRPVEGDSEFRGLRRLWREGEYFVEVPSRLRWLRDSDGESVRTVHAIVGSDRDLRMMARVSQFQNSRVPFRPQEFGIRDVRPGFRFSARVSFGHNGPFLRPVAARTN